MIPSPILTCTRPETKTTASVSEDRVTPSTIVVLHGKGGDILPSSALAFLYWREFNKVDSPEVIVQPHRSDGVLLASKVTAAAELGGPVNVIFFDTLPSMRGTSALISALSTFAWRSSVTCFTQNNTNNASVAHLFEETAEGRVHRALIPTAASCVPRISFSLFEARDGEDTIDAVNATVALPRSRTALEWMVNWGTASPDEFEPDDQHGFCFTRSGYLSLPFVFPESPRDLFHWIRLNRMSREELSAECRSAHARAMAKVDELTPALIKVNKAGVPHLIQVCPTSMIPLVHRIGTPGVAVYIEFDLDSGILRGEVHSTDKPLSPSPTVMQDIVLLDFIKALG